MCAWVYHRPFGCLLCCIQCAKSSHGPSGSCSAATDSPPKSSHLVHNKVVGLHVTETHYCVAMFHESIVIVSREHLYYFSLKMCSIFFSESKHRWGPAMAQWSAWASLTPSHPPQCFSWCLLRKWEEQSKKRETLPRWTMSCLWHQWIALINW